MAAILYRKCVHPKNGIFIILSYPITSTFFSLKQKLFSFFNIYLKIYMYYYFFIFVVKPVLNRPLPYFMVIFRVIILSIT